MKQLCIFTPTYNREHTLKRLYESLKKQTDSRFYWLVVDDGSTDGTQSLFDSFAKESAIEIEYIKVANGGKQRACNLAAEKCTSELFMCVDSDDYLTPDAVHFILTAWKNAGDAIGIVTPRSARNNQFPSNTTAKLSSLYSKYGYKGETCIATLTSVIKSHPFYIAEGESFIPEVFQFDQIDHEYYHLLCNREICKGEYLTDGYTANYKRLLLNNPRSYAEYKKQCIEFSDTLIQRFKETILYLMWSKIAGDSILFAFKKAKSVGAISPAIPFAAVLEPLFKKYMNRA